MRPQADGLFLNSDWMTYAGFTTFFLDLSEILAVWPRSTGPLDAPCRHGCWPWSVVERCAAGGWSQGPGGRCLEGLRYLGRLLGWGPGTTQDLKDVDFSKLSKLSFVHLLEGVSCHNSIEKTSRTQ